MKNEIEIEEIDKKIKEFYIQQIRVNSYICEVNFLEFNHFLVSLEVEELESILKSNRLDINTRKSIKQLISLKSYFDLIKKTLPIIAVVGVTSQILELLRGFGNEH